MHRDHIRSEVPKRIRSVQQIDVEIRNDRQCDKHYDADQNARSMKGSFIDWHLVSMESQKSNYNTQAQRG
jgi:hypothetical protein